VPETTTTVVPDTITSVVPDSVAPSPAFPPPSVPAEGHNPAPVVVNTDVPVTQPAPYTQQVPYGGTSGVQPANSGQEEQNPRISALDQYRELARLNQELRSQSRGPRATQDDLSRYARQGLPQPLSRREFDPAFGVVNWPGPLRLPAFEEERVTMDRLLSDYCMGVAGHSEAEDLARQILRSIDELQGKLKQQINDLSPMEYLYAKKFLERLRFELQRQPDPQRWGRQAGTTTR
jgi:hypothetical protein